MLDLDATVRGTAALPDISGSTEIEGLWYAEAARWLDVAGPFAIKDGGATVDLLVGVAGDPLGMVEGRVPLVTDLAAFGPDPSGDLDLSVVLAPAYPRATSDSTAASRILRRVARLRACLGAGLIETVPNSTVVMVGSSTSIG